MTIKQAKSMSLKLGAKGFSFRGYPNPSEDQSFSITFFESSEVPPPGFWDSSWSSCVLDDAGSKEKK